MTVTLHVDAVRWRDNVARAIGDRREVLQSPGGGEVIAVIKGNGYGFSSALLAREATRAGIDTIAVGTAFEVAEVVEHFERDILVLQPFDPRDTESMGAWNHITASPHTARVVRTVASIDAAQALSQTDVRVVVELLSSVRRFGITRGQISDLLAALGVDERLRGMALHLPLSQPDSAAAVAEVVSAVSSWQTALDDLQLPPQHLAQRVLVSHLDIAQLRQLRQALPTTAMWPRVGTELWLGDPTSLRTTGTVLAVHEPSDTAIGYRQRKGPRGARLIVVSGGTSHGIALAAPSANVTVRQRAIAATSGVLDAAGRTTSPFTISGAQRLFAEPPHMHVSLVWLPGDVEPPAVGDEVDVRVRNTTARFDRVVGLD